MLNMDGSNFCQLCFSRLPLRSEGCPYCSGQSNSLKYPTALKEGIVLAGRYAVGRVLGMGGFGVTYLCYDLKEKRRVAIKEYMPQTIAHRNAGETTVSSFDGEKEASFRLGAEKFYDEARLVSRFNGNPNIISVYEFFYQNNTSYFVMEYLDGVDLKQYIRDRGGKISEGEVCYITDRVTEALLVIHSAGVLHRDISPDNIFLSSNGDIKLIDFGAARQVVGEASKSLSVILKQGFAPLEQYQRHGRQGPWTDIYALGATAYYAITGTIPDDPMSRLDGAEPDLSPVSPGLAGVLKRMLAVRIEDRYRDVIELKRELSSLRIRRILPDTEKYGAARDPIREKKPETKREPPKPKKPETNREPPKPKLPEKESAPRKPEVRVKEIKPTTHIRKPSKKMLITAVCAIAAAVCVCVAAIFVFSGRGATEKKQRMATEKLQNDGYVVWGFHDGRAKVMKNGAYGYIDINGELVIPAVYEEADHFSDGLARVESGRMWGYIDTNGNAVVPVSYDSIEEFDDGLACVCKNDLFGFVDRRGKVIVPIEYDSASDFREGLASVEQNGKFGFIDTDGKQVIPLIYDDTGVFSEGLAKVSVDDEYGFIDTDGNIVIECGYDHVKSFSEGLAAFKKGDLYGYIDKSGNTVISAKYEKASDFSEGLAAVCLNGKRGYINKNGETVIPFIYDYAGSFKDGIANVDRGKNSGYIDTSGEIVVPLEYENMGGVSEGLIAVCKNDRWGYIDMQGNTVISFLYDYADDFEDGIAGVGRNGRDGFIDRQGNVTWYN